MTRDSRPSPAWDETQSGSVGEADRAAVRNAQSPNPFNSDPADNHSHRDNNASGKGIE